MEREKIIAEASEEIGSLLVLLRKRANLNQKDLAERMHERLPERAASTLSDNIGFKLEGGYCIKGLVLGHTRYKPLFDAYLEEVVSDPTERQRIYSLLDDFKEIIRTPWTIQTSTLSVEPPITLSDGQPELRNIQMYLGLPQAYRKKVNSLIEELAEQVKYENLFGKLMSGIKAEQDFVRSRMMEDSDKLIQKAIQTEVQDRAKTASASEQIIQETLRKERRKMSKNSKNEQ